MISSEVVHGGLIDDIYKPTFFIDGIDDHLNPLRRAWI